MIAPNPSAKKPKTPTIIFKCGPKTSVNVIPIDCKLPINCAVWVKTSSGIGWICCLDNAPASVNASFSFYECNGFNFTKKRIL